MGLDVVDQVAYVDVEHYRYCIDVTDPHAPSRIECSVKPEGVIRGNTAYVIDRTNVQVLDVSVPSAPRIIEKNKNARRCSGIGR